MIVFMWLIVIIAFAAAFLGLVMPMIPSVLMMWIGFLVYQFGIDRQELSWFFWLAMGTLTVILLLSDYIAGGYFVKKYGGSKAGELTAAVGVFVGSFIFPPLGIILVPLVAVFIVEWITFKDAGQAMKSSIGSLFGFLTSTAAKMMILVIMVIWFFLDVWV